jgi:hypothetical protein
MQPFHFSFGCPMGSSMGLAWVVSDEPDDTGVPALLDAPLLFFPLMEQ